ncbi:HutD family protein [Bordetella sp. FB-8]|uniref:HutD/Ves family protein n=1 Tax=Bordetella sp. FB-8 TaxID=1159870 RepID=UPI000361F448|nr:HutD family protein [Bordetella sp. FB-8]
MSLQRFDRATLPASPWKNGGGVTREIACWPPGAGMDDFQWRLSIAAIAASGPFSAFAGVDRIITLLDGPGVRLASSDGAIDHVLNRPLEPFPFPGEAMIHGTMLGAVSSDLNVMTRRALLGAEIKVLRASASSAASAHGMLLAAQGRWHAHASTNTTQYGLEPGQGGWWAEESLAWRLEPLCADAALICVRMHATAQP